MVAMAGILQETMIIAETTMDMDSMEAMVATTVGAKAAEQQ